MLKHLWLPETESATQASAPWHDLTSHSSYWAYHEFALVELGDKRLNQRLQRMATAFGKAPLSAVPEACGRRWSESKAAYRFLSNERVDYTKILACHEEQTLGRAQGHEVVLCPQDTTSLNYTPHSLTKGLGPIGNKAHTPIGFFVHSTVAVNPQGEFLGVLDAQLWARKKKKSKKSKVHRNRKPIEQKESYRWLKSFKKLQEMSLKVPNVQWVSVGDREADLYELFELASAAGNSVELLIRVQHDRRVVAKEEHLKHHLRAQEVAGTMTVRVPRTAQQPSREATLALRFGQITLYPPCLKKRKEPLSLYAVMAEEINPPQGCKPIRWFLITTLRVTTLAEAEEKVRWYAKRWVIEEFHRVLKSGCKVEQRQLETRERLQRALSIDMVVAWRVLSMTKAARLYPDLPASQWLSQEEWQSLYCYINETNEPTEEVPGIRQAVRWIAGMGGFLGRKSDGEPGTITVWRGLTHLTHITACWLRFRKDP